MIVTWSARRSCPVHQLRQAHSSFLGDADPDSSASYSTAEIGMEILHRPMYHRSQWVPLTAHLLPLALHVWFRTCRPLAACTLSAGTLLAPGHEKNTKPDPTKPVPT